MAVKKTHSAEVHGRLTSVKMWLEDIEEIGFWVQEVPSSKPIKIKVEIAGSEYSLDRIADLEEIKNDKIDSIEIKHGDGLLEVRFGSSGSSLSYTEGDPRVKASVRQISFLAKQHCRSRIVPWYHPADPGARWILLLGLGVVSLTIGAPRCHGRPVGDTSVAHECSSCRHPLDCWHNRDADCSLGSIRKI
ncbi:hypothetical protein OHS58_03910 [Amycolatopsis sp. NBC_00348]|uniref:hypothetical protein n=1 Tax=Amycolatopsis sp. NBC_00348 TaxID=2975956 RepID=UPI002E2567B1